MSLYSHLHTSLRFNIFSCGESFIFSLPKCLFLHLPSVGPPSTSGHHTWASGWGRRRGEGGERMSCLCVRVCSAGIGGRGGGSLLPSFSLYVKSLEFVVTVHRQRPLEFVSGGVGSRTFYHRGPATLCFIFLCFDHFFF